MIEVDTIGNATLIVSENGCPLLATDVWLEEDSAYFGSWVLSHVVPHKQRSKIKKCKYIFISHYHPDHLNLGSLRHCKGATILLAQHYGSRVERDLRSAGFTVLNLPSRKWISLGVGVRIMLFNNELQDSALMIEIDEAGRKSLLVNLNDSGAIGFAASVARLASSYQSSIYLGLHGYGDADMINFFDLSGRRIPPLAAKRLPVGADVYAAMRKFGCNIAIPFSSFHQYQRRDSWWANEFVTPVQAYFEGFPVGTERRIYAPFQQITFEGGEIILEPINPAENMIEVPVSEAMFGDDWSEILSGKDFEICKKYFQSISTLSKGFRSIDLLVGGVKHRVLSGQRGAVELQFEVPRKSLLRAVRREIFDDLLIGNFMKTTIIGSKTLYSPDFTLSVAKYSDNGGVKLADQMKEYFAYYKSQRPLPDRLESRFRSTKSFLASWLSDEVRIALKSLIRRR